MYQLADGLIFKEVRGEGFILNVKTGAYFGVNGVGADFIKLLDGNKSFEDIIGELLNVYNVDSNVISEDMKQYLLELKSKNIIVEGE